MAAIFRAIFGYCFLVFIVRIAGRRPGRQMAPFDFLLVFFLGGLTLTEIVADDRSLTNALTQIVAIACSHYFLTWLRRRSQKVALVIDGTPLMLLRRGVWFSETMEKMHFSSDDVMAAAREEGLENLEQVAYAVLERAGSISIIPAQKVAQ